MADHEPGRMARLLRGPIARQLAAVVAVALALLLRLALAQQSITLPTYITFYPALIFAALVGGMGAGILATALSALIADYLLMAPVGHLTGRSISDTVGLVIFCISGTFISVVMELYHRNRERLAAYQTEAAVLNERRKIDQERALAESMRAERQRFLEVLETLPTMISLLTPDHKIAFANRSFRERFGACQGLHCHEACFGRTEPCEFCESYTVLNTGQPHRWELIFEDGSLIDAYDYPFTDLDGSSLVLQMGVDITERRRAENALETHREELEALVSERTRQLQTANLQLESDVRELARAESLLEATMQRFYRMLSNLNAGVLLVTDDERIEFANQAYCDIFGLDESPADLMESFDSERMIERIKTLHHNSDQAAHRVREILEQGKPVLGEEVTMQNGSTFLRDFVPLTVDGKSYGRMWVHTDITERLRGQEALRESQAKLAAAMASMTDSVIITDADGRFVEFNGAFATFYRFKSKEECARNFEEFASMFDVFMASGERAPREMYALQRALRGESATNVEYTLRRKESGETWIGSLSFSPIRDHEGAITGAVVTGRDITEAKRVEMRQRRFYETDLFAILYWKIDGGVVDVNDKFLEMTGYSREDVRAGLLNWAEITPPEYWVLDEDARRQVRETGVHLPYEKEFICKDGTRVWGLVSAVAYEDNRNEGVSFILDITARKRIEQELAKTSLQAERSASQLRTIFENVGERLYVCDSSGNVILANDVARQSYGQDEGAVAPPVEEMESCIVVFDLQGSPMPKAEWPISRVLRGEQVHSHEIRVRFRGTNQERVLSCSGSAIRDQNGNITMAVLTSADITEAKQDELQLKRLNRTLKAMSNSNLAILHAVNEADYLNEVCRIITRDCGHTMVWIGIAENDENKTIQPLAYSGLDEVYMENLLVTWDDSERGRGPAGTAIRTGEPSICRDILTDASFTPWRDEAVKRGYASALAIPLKEQTKTWGAIVIHSRQPDAFSLGEVHLLTELAADIDVGIQTLRMRAARAQAEELLRESTELLELFVVHAPAALAMFDREMRYLHASRRWKADYGLGDCDLQGVSHYDVFPETSNIWKEAHRRGLAGEVVGGEADRFERADGSVQWVHWEVRPWHDAEGKVGGIVIFSEDITARKKAEEALLQSEKETLKRQQLQALAERLRQAREEERKMVARDLHDDIGQILTAIKMDMSWVMRHLSPEEDKLLSRLTRSIALVNDGVYAVRKICSGLRPGILDDLGLVAAIEWQMNEFASRTGISCQFTVPHGELHLDSDRTTAIFRIFQECLTNVARHAEAKSVRVSLYEQDENLMLVVEDDGKGFHESEIANSLGILGMKERAAACGGGVQVSSSTGNGTTIIVRVPIHIVSDQREDHAHSTSR
ncbi:MAG: PAS domain S-box protein [Terracidiphilus sp.]|nr:PAS domain S-box protein [Terracidiphilus sp.]